MKFCTAFNIGCVFGLFAALAGAAPAWVGWGCVFCLFFVNCHEK